VPFRQARVYCNGMARSLVLVLLLAAGVAQAQEQEQPRVLTPDEQAFARLPADVQGLLSGLPVREALLKYEFARQNLIALGTPYPTPERLRAQIETVLAPPSLVQGYSAGATTFPPLSPLVPAISFEYR
jgi:hypothetical protein